LRRVAGLALYALLAVGLHAGVVLGVTGMGGAFGPGEGPAPKPEKVVVRVVDPPPPVPLEEPEVAALENDAEVAPPSTDPEPARQLEPAPRPRKRTAPIPADPIDARAPEPVEQPTQRRRVVGLSMESTVTSGSGPAFAVGNTRMGRTGDVAEDASRVQKLSTADKGSGSAPPGPNRIARSVPGSSVEIVKPQRLGSPSLVYPSVLKAQGIEGNVAVMIRIAADGNVLSAKVLKSSGYAEFDAAAREAALKERFAPATRGGDPIEYTLKYTYRFRIKDA